MGRRLPPDEGLRRVRERACSREAACTPGKRDVAASGTSARHRQSAADRDGAVLICPSSAGLRRDGWVWIDERGWITLSAGWINSARARPTRLITAIETVF